MADFLFELFFELFAEGISSIYAGAYIRLVRVFDREKVITAKTERKIEIIATVVTVVLMFAMVIGICILSDGEMYTLGMCLTFIPLALLIFQMALSIVMIVKDKKYGKK